MTISFLDACRFLAASPGSGPFVVGSAVTGYQLPSAAGAVNGATYRYRAESSDLTQWEVGYGVYTSGSSTLTRANVLFSSNSNVLVAFASAPQVAVVYLAEDVLSAQNNLSELTSAATARTNLGNLREVLIASRTYFVSTTGSDSNNGLTSGTSFLTIQKAVDTACALDLSIYSVAINVGAGTYTNAVVLKSYVGAGPISIVGDTTTPSNVFISVSGSAVSGVSAFDVLGSYNIGGFKIATTSGNCVEANGSIININGKMEYGASGNDHISASNNGTIVVSANYTVSGDCARAHISGSEQALVRADTITITINGARTFLYTALADRMSFISFGSTIWTVTVSVTSTRYVVQMNSVIYTAGAGATFIPGSISGTTSSGGQYV